MDSHEKIVTLQRCRVHRRVRYWKNFLEKYNCQNVCEIGVRNGENFDMMIQHNPTLAVAVDAWMNDGIPGNNDMFYSQRRMDKQYRLFSERMADKPFVKIIRDYSHNAAQQFDNGFFDFIYIDANHTFNGCYQDVVDWWPKLKVGGVMCGHDYEKRSHKGILFGVIEAVNKFVWENNITTFFILWPHTWGIVKRG